MAGARLTLLWLSAAAEGFHVGYRPAGGGARIAPAPRMGEWVTLGTSSVRGVRVTPRAAYRVLRDYARWPEWSPWLSKVEVDAADDTNSKWFLRVKGIDVSWVSRTTGDTPPTAAVSPAMISWESTAGVRNGGSVNIAPGGGSRESCDVSIELGFEVPKVVAALFSARFVEEFVSRRLLADLQRFAKVAEAEAGVREAGAAPEESAAGAGVAKEAKVEAARAEEEAEATGSGGAADDDAGRTGRKRRSLSRLWGNLRGK